MEHLAKTLVDWIEIESITGSEADYGDAEDVGFCAETSYSNLGLQEFQHFLEAILATFGTFQALFFQNFRGFFFQP